MNGSNSDSEVFSAPLSLHCLIQVLINVGMNGTADGQEESSYVSIERMENIMFNGV